MKPHTTTINHDYKTLTEEVLSTLKDMHKSISNPTGAKFFNSKELCSYLNIKPSKMRKMVFEKRVPHTKVGRELRFCKLEIDNWLESNSVSVAAD
jgi:excisionase family DNA binding protein